MTFDFISSYGFNELKEVLGYYGCVGFSTPNRFSISLEYSTVSNSFPFCRIPRAIRYRTSRYSMTNITVNGTQVFANYYLKQE